MKVSKKVSGVEYAIRDIVSSAKDLEKQGKTIDYLNIGDPVQYGFHPPENVKQAYIDAIKKDQNYYSASEGIQELRSAIAEKENSKGPRGFCKFPFTQFNITVDGTVNKCCADLYFSDPMGNVNEKDILTIWDNQKFRYVRRSLLRGDRYIIQTCRKCDYYGVTRFKSKLAYYLYYLTL